MKVAVIYASTTGNTEAMANAINEACMASVLVPVENRHSVTG